MVSKIVMGSTVALALILIPEPITTATGTMAGAALLLGVFGVSSGVL